MGPNPPKKGVSLHIGLRECYYLVTPELTSNPQFHPDFELSNEFEIILLEYTLGEK